MILEECWAARSKWDVFGDITVSSASFRESELTVGGNVAINGGTLDDCVLVTTPDVTKKDGIRAVVTLDGVRLRGSFELGVAMSRAEIDRIGQRTSMRLWDWWWRQILSIAQRLQLKRRGRRPEDASD